MAGTLTSLPFDVIRTRMVAQPETDKMYLSVRDAALKLKSEGGIRAFYKGKKISFFLKGQFKAFLLEK